MVKKSLRNGWRALKKKKFPQLYARREDSSTTPDGLLCLNDRNIIPPTLRRAVLDDLHSSHLGVEKMNSLARLTLWWTELDTDLARHAKNCQQCFHKKPKQPSKWSPWSMASEQWQRLHANYCGPFLRDYYALVLVDAFKMAGSLHHEARYSGLHTKITSEDVQQRRCFCCCRD